MEVIDQEKEVEEIREAYDIEPDDFQKLRRRATDFFKIAFSSHLGIVFQPVRDEVDAKFGEPTADSYPFP